MDVTVLKLCDCIHSVQVHEVALPIMAINSGFLIRRPPMCIRIDTSTR